MQLTSNARRTTTDSPTPLRSRSARSWWRSGSDARRLRSERGAAIIEAAITLPLLLALSVGIFEFGRAYQTYQILTNAAREGARIAVLPNPVPGAAEARVREYLNMGGLVSDSTVGVAITPVNTSMGSTATAPGSQVTVTYPFSFIMLQPVAQLLVSGSLAGAPITITSTSIMRNETGS